MTMFRFTSLFLLATLFFACGGSDAQTPPDAAATTPTPTPTGELRLNEKGRVPYSAELTFADGPFAGTHQLVRTKENRGIISLQAARQERIDKFPYLEGKSGLSALSLTTADGSFGIANLSRYFTGAPAVGELAGFASPRPVNGEIKCGAMQLHTDDAPGVIRHVYVTFLDCGPLTVTGFGDEWKKSSIRPSRTRPMAGRLTGRVLIEDVNTTEKTRAEHETTMTLTFVGGHIEATE